MTLVQYHPHWPLRSLMDNFIAQTEGLAARSAHPATNIIQTEHGYRIDLAVPGLAKEDFNLEMTGTNLKISAARKNGTEADTYRRREFSFTSFEKIFRLPKDVDTDQVTARYLNGVLSVELVRKPEVKPAVKTIEVAG